MERYTRIFDCLQQSENSLTFAKRDAKGWHKFHFDDILSVINNLSKGLLAIGLKKGDRVALMSGNRPEWNFVDFACNQLGIAIIPLYPTLSAQDLAYILEDSEAKLLFVSSAELTKKAEKALSKNKLSTAIYTLDKVAHHQHYEELIEAGKTVDIDLKSYNDAVLPDDLLTLIYTSGTTGKPKGVYLTHKNILSNVQACQKLIPKGVTRTLSFLPLSHIFERMTVYLYIRNGFEIYYAENLDNIVVDINDVKPHLFTTVPRVLEKVYDKIIEKGKALPFIKKAIFNWAVDHGHQFQEPQHNSVFYMYKLALARKLIFSKWKEALGNEIKLIISGGAALQERLARIFWAADIKVLEGYGLTETSPVIAVNSWQDEDVKFGTVGRVLDNLSVRIADDGEILVKGPSITQGYYHNPEATQDAFTSDGYFRTGDIGKITTDGFLKITDRKKEMFKTAGGKYIAPQPIENKLMESTFIAQVMVIGENQKFPAALIVPAFETLEKFAHKQNIPYQAKEELLKHNTILTRYQKDIDRANKSLGQWEKIKKFVLLPTEWSIDNGELTPKLSLKRKIIAAHHQSEIDQIYAGEQH